MTGLCCQLPLVVDPAVRGPDFDDYGRIRLVNFVRARVAADAGTRGGEPINVEGILAQLTSGADGVWTDERFLLPTLEGDALLFAGEEEDEEEEGTDALVVEGHALGA